jgi:hypothetical protein
MVHINSGAKPIRSSRRRTNQYVTQRIKITKIFIPNKAMQKENELKSEGFVPETSRITPIVIGMRRRMTKRQRKAVGVISLGWREKKAVCEATGLILTW